LNCFERKVGWKPERPEENHPKAEERPQAFASWGESVGVILGFRRYIEQHNYHGLSLRTYELFGSRWRCLDVSVGVEVSVSWSVRLVAVPRTEDSLT